MTNAGIDPTIAVEAVDEFRNTREMHIADERPLTIYVDSYEIVTLMTLGKTPELLALGYLKNQGIVEDISEIRSVQVDWEVNAAAVTTYSERDDWKERLGPRIVTTGCGQGTVYGNILEQTRPDRITRDAPPAIGYLYPVEKSGTPITMSTKAPAPCMAALYAAGTEVAIFIEDVGRHNAVDAIAGQMWLEGIPGHDKLFYTTGRLTSEMVMKVAQMGIPALLSRSGITQMGLKLAMDFGVILFSRAKGKHFLVYHGAEHIDFDVSLPPKRAVANLKNAG